MAPCPKGHFWATGTDYSCRHNASLSLWSICACQLACKNLYGNKIALKRDSLVTISHPDVKVNNCAYGHSVAILLNPRGVATAAHKYSVTVGRHTMLVVAAPTSHYLAYYKIKILFQMKFE